MLVAIACLLLLVFLAGYVFGYEVGKLAGRRRAQREMIDAERFQAS